MSINEQVNVNVEKEVKEEKALKEEKAVKFFNEHYKTNYKKDQIDQIYWSVDLYEITTAKAILFCTQCHLCSDPLEIFGSEFCCANHLNEFKCVEKQRKCAINNLCKVCLQRCSSDNNDE
jgi:hypothetical protein